MDKTLSQEEDLFNGFQYFGCLLVNATKHLAAKETAISRTSWWRSKTEIRGERKLDFCLSGGQKTELQTTANAASLSAACGNTQLLANTICYKATLMSGLTKTFCGGCHRTFRLVLFPQNIH